MSIGKKIRYSLLGLALLVGVLVCGISIYSFMDMKTTFQRENKKVTDRLYEENVEEITGSSAKLAVSLAKYYGQTINLDFERIMGELNTLKGSIQTLYNGEGTNQYTAIRRHKEYIISQAADISGSEVQKTIEQLSGATPMFDNILKVEPNISLAYLVLENGMVVSSTDTFYEDVEKADMRQRDWYQDTLSADALHWSELYTGTDGRYYITCSIPVKDGDENTIGVLAFDIRAEEISGKILNSDDESFVSAFIMSSSGEILLSSLGNDKVKEEPYYNNLTASILKNKESSGYYTDDSSILGYSKVESTGWILVTALDYEKMMAPVNTVAKSVSESGKTLNTIIVNKIKDILVVFAFIVIIVFVIILFLSSLVSRSVTQPVEVLAQGAKIIGDGNLEYEIEDLGTDEIGMLADTVNAMTVRLRDYIDQVTKAAAEKQRLSSELDVARSIQLGMLPKEMECPGYDIYGMMLPAKEVGGDFYDYFRISEDKVCVVAADVSGKGVGAALFMTVAKMVIKTAAQGDVPIEDLLAIANNLLCSENPAELFVTAFVGVIEMESGHMKYACAGHNPPVLIQKDGTAAFLPVKHKLPLAAMEGIQYPCMETEIGMETIMLLYTDGVTEATNAGQELYGDDRLLAAAGKLTSREVKDVVKEIKADVDGFVKEAPQFDDITLIAVRRAKGDGRE